MRTMLITGLAALVCALPKLLYANAPDATATLDMVVVEGEQPGPAIWRLTRPDNDHVLWIVGEPPLLPEGVTWHTQNIERIAKQSQAIVLDGGFNIVPDGKVGVFRALTLIPAILGARKNPNGERLQKLIPAEIYARWLVQKSRYVGSDSGIEKWRPMFAAESLRNKALSTYRWSSAAGLWSVLHKVAKDHGITLVSTSVTFKIAPQEMRSTIKQFARQPLGDIDCFERTVTFIEALANQQSIHARAAAWAMGDLDALRQSTSLPRFTDACIAAILSSQAVAAFDPGHVPARMRTAWIDAVDNSMATNASTLALLPIDELLSPSGRLTSLRDKGYVVEEP